MGMIARAIFLARLAVITAVYFSGFALYDALGVICRLAFSSSSTR